MNMRTRPLRRWLVATLWLLGLGCLPAQAQSAFTCKDDSGRVISSDRPIPECAKRPMRELNANGIVTGEHAPPLTPAQLRQKKIDDEAQRVADLKRRQEQSRDKALLIAYPNMAALESVRELQISDLKSEVAIVEKRMAKDHIALIDAQNEAKSQGVSPSFSVRKKIELIAASILADNDVIARLRGDIMRTNQRFDDDARRLRQLVREPDNSAEAGNGPPLASRQ
jgi:hypothetical protein